jgi:hypothetical protein
MSSSLRTNLNFELGWTWQDTIGSSVTANSNRLPFRKELTQGTGAGHADMIWDCTSAVLLSGTSRTLDLTVLDRGFFGGTVDLELAKVKLVWIVNNNSTGGALMRVGGAASLPWSAPFADPSDKVTVEPGGLLVLANPETGWTVGASSKNLLLESVGGDVEYDIVILGVGS